MLAVAAQLRHPRSVSRRPQQDAAITARTCDQPGSGVEVTSILGRGGQLAADSACRCVDDRVAGNFLLTKLGQDHAIGAFQQKPGRLARDPELVCLLGARVE
jgi:hypothetical protein